MVRMTGGFINPDDKAVEDLKNYIERLAVNSDIGVDITDNMQYIISTFESFSPEQKKFFIGALVFHYVGSYGECFKALEIANHCKQYHEE